VAERTQDSLFKYCSVDTAKQILTSRALRWSSSHLLGDPLELNHDSELGFNTDQLLSAAIKTATSFIFAKDIPRGNAPLLTAIRRWREEERFGSPEEAEEVLKELMGQMVDQRLDAIEKIKADWKLYTRQLRIACFSSRPDNLGNWSQFGDQHRGVVLRFQCDESPVLKDPLAVRYQPARPDLTTLKEQLGVVLLNERHVAQDHFLEKFTTKAIQYSDQQELRCFYQQDDSQNPIDSNPGNWYLDRPLGDYDLKAVYFGLSTRPDDRKAIYELVKKNYTLVKLFDFKLLPGKYELEAERITEKL
jgi:hypothetical protein